MKFGQNLSRNQVPEWSSSYIDYKGLKKLIKSAAAKAVENGGDADLAGSSTFSTTVSSSTDYNKVSITPLIET